MILRVICMLEGLAVMLIVMIVLAWTMKEGK